VDDLAEVSCIRPVGPDEVQGLRFAPAASAGALLVETSFVQHFALAQKATYAVSPALDAGQAKRANRNAASLDEKALAQSAVVGKESREDPVS